MSLFIFEYSTCSLSKLPNSESWRLVFRNLDSLSGTLLFFDALCVLINLNRLSSVAISSSESPWASAAFKISL